MCLFVAEQVDKMAESQLEAWRALIDWEATNPCVLPNSR